MRNLLILLALIVVVGVAFWHFASSAHSDTLLQAKTKQAIPTNTPATRRHTGVTFTPTQEPTTSVADKFAKLNAAYDKILPNFSEIDTSITVVDLKTGQETDRNGSKVVAAASTNKLISGLLFLQKVQNGGASLDDPMGAYSAGFQLQQLINQSNNDSWDLINNFLGFPAELSFADSLGLKAYSADNNTLSTNDMATLLQKLYQGQLLNADNTKLFLSYMENTNEESYIPPAIPDNVKLYHKTGLIDDYVHDGAIIDDGQNPFILVIFTNGNGTYNDDRRAQLFKDLSQTTWDVMK